MSKRTRAQIRATRPVPAPAADEPTDDQLLRYLDGAMSPEERARFAVWLARSPYAAARLELLSEALSESGWELASEEAPKRS